MRCSIARTRLIPLYLIYEYDLKNKGNLKKEDRLKDKQDPKNEDNQKIEDSQD